MAKLIYRGYDLYEAESGCVEVRYQGVYCGFFPSQRDANKAIDAAKKAGRALSISPAPASQSER